MAIGLVGGLPTVGASSALSGAGLLGSVNPYLSAFNAISSLFGGGQKVRVSKAEAGGYADSGSALFGGDNALDLRQPIITLEKPLNVAIAAALVVGAVYVYKRKLR